MERSAYLRQTATDWLHYHPCPGTQDNIHRAFVAGAEWADAHPDWHTMDELPEPDPTMVSRGFNMSLPCLLCDIDNLTAYAGTRYHYDPARYDFDKKQWQDVIGVYDDEIGITHTHWMYEPEPPQAPDPTEETINETF